MSNQTVTKFVVQELTRYGFKANNTYINWSKNCVDGDKAKVVPGGEYECEVYTSESGKQYVNKVLGTNAAPVGQPVAPVAAPVTKTDVKPVVAEAKPKTFTKTYAKKTDDNSMSKEEWAAKDVRISRSGVIQAAVQAVAPAVALDLIFTEASKLADQMLEYVNRK